MRRRAAWFNCIVTKQPSGDDRVVTAPAGRARRRPDHRRGEALLAPPDHPGDRHDRAEAAEERQGAVRRRGRPRLASPALPGRGRRRDAGRDRLRRGGRVQPAAPDHPRAVGHRQAEGRVGPREHRRDQSLRQRSGAHRGAEQRQRHGDLLRLRPDRRRNGQLRHPVHGQRRVRAAGQAVRVGIDLPVRRPGQRVLGRVRAVLSLPVPGPAAAGHGAVLRRGRRARRAVRVDRLDSGDRGDQAADRRRRDRWPGG